MPAEIVEQATLTVDLVLLANNNSFVGYGEQVLLIQGKHGWALPGGKVRHREEVSAALQREMQEEIGLEIEGADLFGVFPAVDRDNRGRYVSFAYTMLLASPDQVEPQAGSEVQWFPLEALPELAFDHAEIIQEALSYWGKPIVYQG